MYGAAALPMTFASALSSIQIQITCWYVEGGVVPAPQGLEDDEPSARITAACAG